MSDNKAILANLEKNYPDVRLLTAVGKFILVGDEMSKKLLMGERNFKGQLFRLEKVDYEKLNGFMKAWETGAKPQEIDYALLDKGQQERFTLLKSELKKLVPREKIIIGNRRPK